LQGLVVPLRWPGESARRAMITRYLAERRVSDLSEACVTRLAGTYAGPPSRLFAALAQLVHVAQTDRRALDDALVEETLDGADENAITPRAILAAVAKQFHVTQADLKGPSRRQAISEARGIAMYLLRELTRATFENIGQQFGGRDHTTVMHACQKTMERLAADERLRQTVESLASNLEEM
jgi:chromosomal replication initiator protein